MIKKIIILFFLLTSFSFALKIPPEYGSILDTFDAGKKSKIFVVVLNNVAANEKVQENNMQILFKLKEEYKNNFLVLGVEGEYGFINTRILNEIPDKDLKNETIDKLIKKGVLTGYEAFVAKYNNEQDKVFLYGVDDWQLLEESREFFKIGISRFTGWKIENETIREKAISLLVAQNIKIDSFYKLLKEYEENKINLAVFLQIILANYKPSIGKYENLKNFQTLLNIKNNIKDVDVLMEKDILFKNLKNYFSEKDWDVLSNIKRKENYYLKIEELLVEKNINIQKNYPNLSEYFDYLHKESQLNRVAVLTEMEVFVDEFIYTLAKNDAEKKLIFLYEYTFDIESFLLNKMTYYKYLEFIENKQKFFKLTHKKLSSVETKNIEKRVAAMQKYYETSVDRSKVVVKNIMNYKSNVLVLVVNGFYVDLVLNNLRARGVSYVNIAPNFTSSKFKQDFYRDRVFSSISVKSFRKNLFEILSEELLFTKNKDVDSTIFYLAKLAIENDLIDDFVKFAKKKNGLRYKDLLEEFGVAEFV